MICVAYSKGLIACGGTSKELNIWNAKNETKVCDPLKGHEGWILAVNFSPNGN